MTSKHTIRKATTEERKYDCCGDRYPCYIDLVCSCGLKGCRSCIKNHLLELHTAELPSTFGQMTGNLKVPPIVEALGPLTERDLLGFASEPAAPIAPAADEPDFARAMRNKVVAGGFEDAAEPAAPIAPAADELIQEASALIREYERKRCKLQNQWPVMKRVYDFLTCAEEYRNRAQPSAEGDARGLR